MYKNMENYYYSNNQYKSINLILDDFSSDIFEGITWIIRPVIGAVDYLKRIHKLYQIQWELKKITNLDPVSKEKLLDLLTDIASIDIYNVNLDNFKNEMENRISETEDFKELFKKLESFSTKLNVSDKTFIFEHSLRRLNGRITSIRDEISSRIWDKNEDANQLLVLDQMFSLIQEMIKDTVKKIDDPKKWVLIAFSLLKIEAFHRGKITFDDLQAYISDLSSPTLGEKMMLKDYNIVFEALD